ncbi:MAG TPA: hypothetical protein VGL23_01605 [Chloroflexota bacterium]|jgi:hypothetical protein
MTLTTVRVPALVELARRAGLDGSDRGAVRRLIWAELGTDAIDHSVVEQVVEHLRPDARQPPTRRARRV